MASPPRPADRPGGAGASARRGAPGASGPGGALRRSRPSRWVGGFGAHPVVLDVALVLALEIVTGADVVHVGPDRWWVWVLQQALLLPLLVRRRWPSAVFTLLAGVAFVQWLTDTRLVADAALLVALYTLATRRDRRRALLATAVLEFGVLLASVRFSPAGGRTAASLVFLSGLVAAALFLGTAVGTRRAYLASLVDRAERLERERDQQARLAATAERTRIAREMHDIVAHSLSVVIALADGAALSNAGGPAEATEAMEQVSRTGRQALAEMRRLLGVLREQDAAGAELAPQPGLSQLDDLLGQVRAAGLPVRFTVRGSPPAGLPATVEATVYRVVQEALTNVRKHATEATGASVTLSWAPGTVTVDVRDDGRPGVPADGAAAGHGLAGMAERVALFGGGVEAGPTPTGWRVRARVPLDPPAPA